MTGPFYGGHTAAMLVVANVPDRPDDAAGQAKCPYCVALCWVMPSAEERLRRVLSFVPLTFTAACTSCAIWRGFMQLRMDRERWEKENAEVCDAVNGQIYPSAACPYPGKHAADCDCGGAGGDR